MPRAVVKGTVVAESDDYQIVDGAVYFPPDSIRKEFFKESTLHSTCPWKGVASYYSVSIGGAELLDVAWYYPRPSKAAVHIRGHVAFYPDVTVELEHTS